MVEVEYVRLAMLLSVLREKWRLNAEPDYIQSHSITPGLLTDIPAICQTVNSVNWLTANREVRGSTPRSNLSIPEINFSDLHSPSARSGL